MDQKTPDLRELSEAFDRIEAALTAARGDLADARHRAIADGGDVADVDGALHLFGAHPRLHAELCDLRLKAFGYVVRADLVRAKVKP